MLIKREASVIVVLAMVFAMLFTACGETGDGEDNIVYEYGDIGSSGGYIFYVHEDPEGFYVEGFGEEGQPGYFRGYFARYLEYAPFDLLQDVPWQTGTSGDFVDIAGTEEGLGLGRKNTAHIISNYSAIMPAAAASVVPVDGLSGWFLPSREELALMMNFMWGEADINLSGDY